MVISLKIWDAFGEVCPASNLDIVPVGNILVSFGFNSIVEIYPGEFLDILIFQKVGSNLNSPGIANTWM